jgi:DNA repair exonuclease SbcCD ATPase subunit
MNRSHIMNVLSYENYCLKGKLQELLEKMSRLQGEKIEKDDPTPPPPITMDPEKEADYKEMINKRDIEIEQLKDIITSLTTKEQENQYTTEQSDEKTAQYEAAILALQEQHRVLNEKTANSEIIITSYQEQHNLLHETVKNHEATIAEYQEQHNLLHETVKNHQQEIENKHNELIQLQNTLNDERDQFRTIIVGKDAEIAHYKR